jgi:protein involved in polysaccharide export with SLBB domain
VGVLLLSNVVTSVASRIGAITLASADITNAVSTLSQIASNQNNYSLGSGDILRISSDAARDITGLVATTGGDARLLVNVGSFDITLKHQNTSSAAENRFLCAGASDYTLSAGASAPVVYDATSAGWRVG